VSTRRSLEPGTTVLNLLQMIRPGRRKQVAASQEVLAELIALRGRMPHVTGSLVATIDGLLVVHDTHDVQAESVAAMSAAQLGLGQQLARGAARGEFLETVTRADSGYVAVFAAASAGLLTVMATADLNLGRLHHEARPVAARIGALLAPVAARHAAGGPSLRSRPD
jgi:predicted regulator of Ras-like GTPase activity (Roadblock/LC7/MglB family)